MLNVDYGLFAVTLLGSVAMYMFSLHQGFEGAVSFLKRMFPNRAQVFYDRVDFIVVTLFGSFIGYIIFEPSNTAKALTAGLGWISAISIIMNKIKKGGE